MEKPKRVVSKVPTLEFGHEHIKKGEEKGFHKEPLPLVWKFGQVRGKSKHRSVDESEYVGNGPCNVCFHIVLKQRNTPRSVFA